MTRKDIPVTGLAAFLEDDDMGPVLDFDGGGSLDASENEDALAEMVSQLLQQLVLRGITDIEDMLTVALKSGMDIGAQYALARATAQEVQS